MKEKFNAKITKGDTVRHGSYALKIMGARVVQGHYTEGQRTGYWRIRHSPGKIIAAGNYQNDTRINKWKFYAETGDLIQIFDYSIDSLIFYNNKLEKDLFNGYGLIPENYPDFMNCSPIFIGGITNMNSMIERNLRYPEAQLIQERGGKVFVSFRVETDGTLSNVEVLHSEVESFNAEAIRLVNLLSGYWIAAIENGRKVSVNLIIPLTFKAGPVTKQN